MAHFAISVILPVCCFSLLCSTHRSGWLRFPVKLCPGFHDMEGLLMICRGAMVPCIMLALGGNLVGGPGSSELGLRTTVAITFARLLLVPPIGLAVVMSADKLGFLPANDKMFRFVLLLQHTMPTSILAGMYISLKPYLRTVLNKFIQELSKMWNR
jgi:hypothetical protein